MDEPRYTHEDLIAYAHRVRPGARRRLITDWIGLGLLDHPYKPGLGRGAGSAPATWPASQRELFLNLWKQRPFASIAELCNVPVYLWIFWGDTYVPLRQVRRAMSTWLDRVRFVSAPAADLAAEQMLRAFGRDIGSRATRELLGEALRGRTPDLEQVGHQVNRATRNRPSIRVFGSEREVRVDRRVVMGLISGRVAAEERLSQFPDSLYEWARFFALFGESAYSRDQPTLAKDQQLGWLFSPRHHTDFVKTACATLLTLLGATLGVKPNPNHRGTLFDPAVWEAKDLRGHIRDTHVMGDGLVVEFDVAPDR